VTGASTGIGQATALHLDQLGFQVFAAVRKERDAAALRQVASAALTPLLMDVTDPQAIERARVEIDTATGEAGLCGLVNNAGVGFISPLECVPLDKLRWLFEVNVFGALAVTQAFLPSLRRARGCVVNVSSTASLLVAPFHGPYSASKFALNGLSHALRLELRPLGVSVSVIICGIVRTPIWDKARALTEEVGRDLPEDALTLYEAPVRQFGDHMAKVARGGVAPGVAAAVIARPLTARRPRNTYFVGNDARLYNVLDKLIFGRLRDLAIMRGIGLRNEA